MSNMVCPANVNDINEFFQGIIIDSDANDILTNIKKGIELLKENLIDLTNPDVIYEGIYAAAELFELTEDMPDFFLRETILPLIKFVSSGGQIRNNIAAEQLVDSKAEEDRRNANIKFLKDCYGTNTSAKEYAIRDVNKHLVDCLFVGRGYLENNFGTVKTSQQLNNNIRNYLEKLYSRILLFLKTQSLSDNEALYIEDYPKLYRYDIDSGNYLKTNALELVLPIIDRFLSPGKSISFDAIKTLYRKTLEGDANSKLRLEAYNANVFLKHFDSYLHNLLGKSIQILNFGIKNGRNKYSFSDTITETSNTFREKDPVVEDEVSKVVKLLINTMPIYSRGDNTPSDTETLTFLDFESIISKLKALSINKDFSSIVFDFDFINGLTTKNIWTTLSSDVKNFILNKRLSEIISYIRTDEGIATKSLFEILNNPYFLSTYKNLIFSSSRFKPKELTLIWSIYLNIFNQNNPSSILSCSNYNDTRNYYHYLTLIINSIYDNKYIQIYSDYQGNVSTRMLTDMTSANILRNLESNINNALASNFSKLDSNLKTIFDQIIDSLNISPLELDNNTYGITYIIPNTNVLVKITFATLQVEYYHNNEKLDIFDDFDSLSLKDVLTFTDLFTLLDLSNKSDLLKEIIYLSNGDTDVMQSLLAMTSRIIANKYVNEKLIDRRLNISLLIKKIYGENTKFHYDGVLKQTLLVSPNDSLFIRKKLVEAIASVTGQTTAILVKDSEQASLSLQTYSRLIGSITSLWDLIEKKMPSYVMDEYEDPILDNNGNPVLLRDNEGRVVNRGSASRDFILLHNPDLFKGYYSAHEFYKPGDLTKKVTDFTVAELVYAGVFKNFAPGLFNDQENFFKTINNGNVMILASVNSDKNTIGYINANINTEVNVVDENGVVVGKKAFKDFTEIEYLNLISLQMGLYYQRMFEKILDDFDVLTNYIRTKYLPSLTEKGIFGLTPLKGLLYINNFAEFKAWFRENNNLLGFKNEVEFVKEICLRYNSTHRNNPIELVENIHLKGSKLENSNTILSLLYTFNPNFLKLRGFKPKKGITYYNKKQFWEIQKSEIFRTLVNCNFEMDLFQDTFDNNQLKEKFPDWVSDTLHLVYATYNLNGESFKISSKSDILKLQVLTGKTLSLLVQDGSELITLHPVLEQYNYIDYLITLEWMNAGVGSFVAHPEKSGSNDTLELESSLFLAQHKRNVSWTAQMLQESLNRLKGMPEYMNIATIEDAKDFGTVISGRNLKMKPYDGSTMVNPFTVYLENGSLGSAAVGLTKKDFCHFKSGELGTGGIIKTACFAYTNDSMRNSPLQQNIMEKMTNRRWFDENGLILTDFDITKNFFGESINYGENLDDPKRSGIFFKEGNSLYKLTRLEKDSSSPNTYIRYKALVHPDDFRVVGDEIPETLSITTNYLLWKAFGGVNSMEPAKNEFKLVPSENSIKLVVKAINECGIIRDGSNLETVKSNKLLSLREIYQPLKHSDIHWLVTEGAIKQGTANLNPVTSYKDRKPLNFYKIRLLQMGPLLDKEHHADNAEVSLFTLVISAAAQTPYTLEEALNLYRGLRRITEIGMKKIFSSLQSYIDGVKIQTSLNDFSESVLGIIIDSLAEGDSDSFAENLAEQIKLEVTNKLNTYIESSIPLSDNALFNKSLSNFANYLSNIGIKLKVPGVLCVLNPSYELFKLYGNRKFESFNNPNEELERLLQKQFPISSLSLIEFGRMYLIVYNDILSRLLGETELDYVNRQVNPALGIILNKELLIKQLLNIFPKRGDESRDLYIKRIELEADKEMHRLSNPATLGLVSWEIMTPKLYYSITDNPNQISSITEWIKEGRNLGAYNVRFNTDQGTYLLWDLDSIRNKHTLKEISEIKDYLERLNAFNSWNIDYLFSSIDEARKFYDRQTLKDLERISTRGLNRRESFNKLKLGEHSTLKTKKLLLWAKNNLSENDYREYLKLESEDDQIAFIERSDSLDNVVTIGKRKVKVDLSSIKVQPFELIMPKLWQTEFGFSDNEDLNTVKNDLDYFIKLYLRNKNHDQFIKRNLYDIVLENSNGKHVYIINKSELINTDNLSNIDDSINTLLKDGKQYRLDSNDEIMYEILPGTSFYMTTEGKEVIAIQSNSLLSHYIDNIPHLSVNISPNLIGKTFNVLLILTALESSKLDKRFANNLRKIATIKTDYFYKDIEEAIEDEEYDKTLASYIMSILRDWNSVTETDYLKKMKPDNPIFIKGRLKHAAFLKSLDIVAARIPALAMQSFMAMKIVAYDNPNKNNAFVSDLQFFLLGSDLDIDSVTLCSFNISRNGLLDLWSPYVNTTSYPLLNASMHLPLPTGQSVQYIETSEQEVLKFLSKYRNLFILDSKSKEYSLHLLTTVNDINKLSEFLKERFIPILKISNSKSSSTNEFLMYMGERINEHNMYLDNMSLKKLFRIMTNYTQQLLYDIISDPINQKAAQISVDEVTGPVKSSAGTEVLKRTAGNSLGKYESINDNQEGKDCIAKSASSIKGFFALTNYFNTILNNGDPVLLNRLIGKKDRDGNFKFLLANAMAKDINTINSEEILDIILSIKNDLEAISFLSALLGLSADNAKELILSKINAGVDMIGMYLYGIATGEDFNYLTNIMKSSTGKTIREVLLGNIFTGEKNLGRASSVFSYFTKYGLLRFVFGLNNIVANKLKRDLKSVGINDYFETLNPKKGDPNGKTLFLLLEILSELSDKSSDIQYKRMVRNLKKYTLRYKSTSKKHLNYLKRLAFGADEMAKLGSFIKNKEIPGTLDEIIKTVSDLEYLIQDSISTYLKYYDISNYEIQMLTETLGLKLRIDLSKPLDISKLLFDKKYLEKAINALDSFKHSFNILDAIKNSEHILGYLKLLVVLDLGYYKNSYRYRSLKELIPELKRGLHLDIKLTIKKLSEYIQKSLISGWLTDTGKYFILPKYNSFFENSGKETDYLTQEDSIINFGEDYNNQTFRMWVEKEVIPNLKLGIIGPETLGSQNRDGSIVANNLFIKDLSKQIRNNTVLGNVSPIYSLPINMIPGKDELANRKLESYLEAFDALRGYTYNYEVNIYGNKRLIKIPIIDLFTLYTMFAHDWKNSNNSLVNVFKHLKREGYLGEYFDYVSSLDKSLFSIKLEVNLMKNLVPYLATKGNPYTSTEQTIIYKDSSLGNILMERLDKEELEEYSLAGVPIQGNYIPSISTLDLGYFTSGQVTDRTKFVEEGIKINGKNKILRIEYGSSKAIKIDGKPYSLKDLELDHIPMKVKKQVVQPDVDEIKRRIKKIEEQPPTCS